MIIQSTRFGELEVIEEQIISFPHGIPGFLDEKAFVHLPHTEDSPFYFLQSITEPNLSFLLVDPFAFLSDYEFNLEDELADELRIASTSAIQVFLVATVKEKVADMTVNLQAPLVINKNQRLGIQLILDNPKYSIRHRLFENATTTGSSEGGR
ncbi:hypothetical protein Desdi_2906 [Desulfitobacterium dichloroeliminans LMG P-21439]|uniref:Flagellar assembly factor FliW n=1 Tax=Desulfitobacterium dichloroeliminans (strain LMG P-21439 / DCA1) TaxID=871963 RepID=L0FBJ1_DESDL|nr:flagellar assembly protein FliW [Desulfitobacterium dichloroeliminans]AGA70318.1 hypothetical protein Desdi_2906 [Desulfitobacterium dichloroeliminans LMG P-21439]